jgi:hypothetical protein
MAERKPDKVDAKWRNGAMYQCVVSKSPGYKVGEVYQCFADDDGRLCLKGRDGFTDLCSMLVSGFVDALPHVDRRLLSVVNPA